MSTSDTRALKAALLGRLSYLVHALYGDRARWTGHEWRLGDVSGEPGASLAIEGRDPRRLGLWHDHNPTAARTGGDVLDLIAGAQATDSKGAVAWAKTFLGTGEPPAASARPEGAVSPQNSTGLSLRSGAAVAEANPRAVRQAAAALFRHKAAMAQLKKRGLTLATIKHFHLGLYSYEGGQGRVKDALSYPVLDARGVPLKRFLRSRLGRVTEGGPDAEDWTVGSPGTYWATPAGGRAELFVCAGARDGWWLWQALQDSPLLERLCVVTSTHGSGIPEAWRAPAFWQGWEKVYLAQDADAAGEALAHRVREVAGRDVLRVRVPGDYGENWTDFFRSGQAADDLAALLGAARVFGVALRAGSASRLPEEGGAHAVVPVDIGRAYVRGHLYAPFRVLEKGVGGVDGPGGASSGRSVQRYRTLVLRSDGTVCTFGHLPAPRGTPREDRVLALSDGTLLTHAPVVDAAVTFSPAAIARFVEARAARNSAMAITPPELVQGVHEHLKGSAVLAREEDYALLTFVVIASYAQAIFDVVPLVQLFGPGGPGLSRTLAGVGCNAVRITGQLPAVAAARTLGRLAGLAVIDDLEEIAKSSGEGEKFILQLGRSTTKATATETWTELGTRRSEERNFYGVKIVVGGAGSADLFPMPTLKVSTRAPVTASGLPSPTTDLQALRDGLHLWVFEHVSDIDHLYRTYLQSCSPQEALTTPLRVLAELLGHTELSGQLQAALALRERDLPAPASPVELLRAAVRGLIRQGYRPKVALKQLLLELHLLAQADAGGTPSAGTPEWREPRWVGRTLRAERLVDPDAPDVRRRLPGEQTRVLTLEPGFVAATLEAFEEKGIAYAPSVQQPLAFCPPGSCDACPYAGFCTMRPHKERQ